MTESTTHIVVGGGAMGLATTWQLARRGHRVIALEQFERGHARGASHGATRNFNNAYQAEDYLDLLALARRDWDELARSTGEPVLRLHGLVTHGDDATVAAVHAALTARGERAEILTPSEAAQRWSGMRFDTDVLHTADAGVVRAAVALASLEAAARRHGADIRFGHVVREIHERPDGARVTVDADGSTYDIDADTVVVTAGAWSRGILPAAFALPTLTVTEESPAHFAAIRTDAAWPSFNHILPLDAYPAHVYGMPTPGEGVKVGFHLVGPVVDPDARTFLPVPALAAQLEEYVGEWMPGLDSRSAAPISCTYTSTDTSDFILDRRGRIVVGAGFSGHGFKFTPAVGSVLADLATDDTARAAETFRISPARL
ncbi:MAG: FAD-dependent oxidoreductase [Microbacterium sp.]